MALLLLATVSAMHINAPKEVNVYDSNSFIIEITNNSNISKELRINFFSPATIKILKPKMVPPHSTTSAQITLKYQTKNYTEIKSKLEVYLDDELGEKSIIQKFYPKNNNLKKENSKEYLGALFGLGAMNLSVLEWSLFITLVIIAIILFITLIARTIKSKEWWWVKNG